MKSTLRKASWVAKVLSPTIWVMALWVVLGGGGQPAYATHFRYGHINWAPVSGNTVQFTVQNAFRRSVLPSLAFACLDPATLTTIPCSAKDGLPGPGDVFEEDIGLTQLLPGDGSQIDSPLGTLLYVVTSIDPTSEWLFALALDPASLPAIDTTISYTYPAAGTFTVAIDSCCRISPVPFSGTNAHINNPDGGYRVETVVNVGTGNSSPVTALPPIILCPINALCSFQVPGVDPDGDPLHFRLSTAPEASSFVPASACAPSTFCQPGPPFAPNAASISSTGLYTWDTHGATLGPDGFNTLYSTQVTIEDLDAAGNVKSKVAVDFFIQLVPVEVCGDGIDNDGDGVIDQNCNPPRFDPPPQSGLACGSTTPITVGTSQSFTIQAADADAGQTVSLNAAGLPAGASMTPQLPTSGNPVSSTFAWTPNVGDVGTYVITFTATDNSGAQAGLQTLCPITLVVTPTPKGEKCVDPQLGLGEAAGCTVLQLGAAKVAITGPAGGILGDICIGPNASLAMSGDEFVTGTINLATGAKFSNSSHGTVTIAQNVDLSAEISAAYAGAASAASLPCTQQYAKLDGKAVTTLTGVVGVNVICVQDIVLSGKQVTLTGPAGAEFIVNVRGRFVFTGGGQGPQLRVAGGVLPSDVLYNIIGAGSDVAFSGGGGGVGCCKAIVDGTVLAPLRKINLSPGLVNGQVISGKDINITSGASVRCPLTVTAAATPIPMQPALACLAPGCGLREPAIPRCRAMDEFTISALPERITRAARYFYGTDSPT